MCSKDFEDNVFKRNHKYNKMITTYKSKIMWEGLEEAVMLPECLLNYHPGS